jgi:hypothetical protein
MPSVTKMMNYMSSVPLSETSAEQESWSTVGSNDRAAVDNNYENQYVDDCDYYYTDDIEQDEFQDKEDHRHMDNAQRRKEEEQEETKRLKDTADEARRQADASPYDRSKQAETEQINEMRTGQRDSGFDSESTKLNASQSMESVAGFVDGKPVAGKPGEAEKQLVESVQAIMKTVLELPEFDRAGAVLKMTNMLGTMLQETSVEIATESLEVESKSRFQNRRKKTTRPNNGFQAESSRGNLAPWKCVEEALSAEVASGCKQYAVNPDRIDKKAK